VRCETAPLLILLGALGTTIPFILFFVGTRRTSAIEAVLCLQTEPVYSLIVAWLFLGHRLTVRRVGAALVLTTGIVLAFVTAPHAVEARERVPAQTAPLATPADPGTGGDEA
jgi:drug/metabolite transporter (DMT)-like permease